MMTRRPGSRGAVPAQERLARKEKTMLLAHPVVLRNLVKNYETLVLLHAEAGGEEVRQRMDDVAYTLCISTGTRDIDAALIAARYQLPGAGPHDDSLVSVGGTSDATSATGTDAQRSTTQATTSRQPLESAQRLGPGEAELVLGAVRSR